MAHRLIALLLSVLLCAAAFAQQQERGDFLPTYYIYHGQRQALEADLSSVAVLASKGTTEAELLSLLQSENVRAVDPVAIPGWFFIRLAVRARSTPEIAGSMRRLLAYPAIEFASPVFHGIGENWVVITPDILMRVREGYRRYSDQVLQETAPGLSVTTRNFGNMNGAFKLRSTSRSGFDVLGSANTLAADTRVEWSEPDAMFSGHADYIPNDPGFVHLWGFRNTQQFGGIWGMDMDADLAWDVTTGSSSVKVLVIDVGVQQDHPDIHQLPGTDLTGQGGGGGPFNVCDNHGTEVAGCVAAIIDNNIGTVGIAPGCNVISARTFISSLACNGDWTSQSSWTVDALTWGEGQGARVSNNSNSYGTSMYSTAIEAKYQSTYNNGMVHFASAGNNANSTIAYPARLPYVNAVAALDPDGTLTSFSCWGTGLDFSAPGINIYTTDRTGAAGYDTGSYRYDAGTSFSSPYVAGVAALIISALPSFTSAQVEARMQARCRDLGAPGYETTYGWGMPNAYTSLRTSITFRVNMKVKMRDRLFCPDSGDVVTVRGMFNSWANTDTLRDPDLDSIYAKSLYFPAYTGTLYKFWKNPRRDMAYEDSIPNRTLDVYDVDAILPAPYFNNDSVGRVSVVSVSLLSGWNMISNPMHVTNDSVRVLYPTSTFPHAYSYSPAGYAQDYTMENRTGYWGKFPSATTQNVAGQLVTRDSLTVVAGWNMVGSISSAVDTGTIVSLPAGLRGSPWYGYSPAGYSPATQIIPGNAYWVKANSAGTFVLASGLMLAALHERGEDPLAVLNSLRITDHGGRSQTLYFGEGIPEIEYALPPLPPAGAFDARFETPGGGSMVRTHSARITDQLEFPVTVQSDAYPLIIEWTVNHGASSYELTDGLGGKMFQPRKMNGEGTLTIANGNVSRFVVKQTGGGELPEKFELLQNFPNPFNPGTTVSFKIPRSSFITMKVYNLLGQEVATLVNELKETGTYSVPWSAEGFASGLYLYRLQAGDFVQTRKLVVLK